MEDMATLIIGLFIATAVCVYLIAILYAAFGREKFSKKKSNPDILDLIAKDIESKIRSPDTHNTVNNTENDNFGVENLEAKLRVAILSAHSREALLNEAMRLTSGNREAAIRKILRDLHADNTRWD
jgi:hypothetical protein